MVDFILLTEDQALVDQLDSFELQFDLCEGEEAIKALSKGNILLLDLSESGIELSKIGKMISPEVYVVALVHGLARKEIKKLLDDYPFIYAHLNFPLIKSDLISLLEDLGSYASQSKTVHSTNAGQMQKFDLEFSLFEDEAKKEEDVIDNQIDQEELDKISKKLGNFNFFEDKEFELQSEENLRVQQKFDTIFLGASKRGIVENKATLHDSLDLNNFKTEEDHIQDDDMSAKNKKNGLDFNMPKLEFDEAPEPKKEDTQQKNSLDFDLEFGDAEASVDEGQDAEMQKALEASKKAQEESGSQDALGLSFDDEFGLEIENQNHNPDATSKTIVFDRNSLKKPSSEVEAPKPDEAEGLDFSSEEISEHSEEVSGQIPESGLDFNSLDSSEEFSLDTGKADEPAMQAPEEGGLDLNLSDEEFEIENSSTKSKSTAPAPVQDIKTKDKTDSLGFELSSDEEFEIENKSSKKPAEAVASNSLTTSDYMTSAEARANIENTIKDIIRPDLSQLSDDKTGDLDLGELAALDAEVEEKTLVANPDIFKKDINEDGSIDFSSEFNYGQTDPSNKTFKSVEDISFETGDRGKGLEEAIQETRSSYKIPDNFEEKEQNHLVFKNLDREEEVVTARVKSKRVIDTDELIQSERRPNPRSSEYTHGNYQDEDFVRAQATIRQLREELEEQLIEVKQLRRENKELEQENLSLRAQNDELKIEQSILRKRHMAETEDLKYQLQLADEKRLTAEERLKHSEKHREKLEQKLRLDFSQVRQREKELESQLELLSIDHDSQIQTRDNKILELRRKIESLEFNMENASIREQKTNEDKKKLEDKLVKIMKTLRHSIENIDEDDHRAVFNRSDVNGDEE